MEPSTRTKVTRRLILVAGVLAALVAYQLLPRLIEEPGLRARAQEDVFQSTETLALDRLERPGMLPLDKVVVANTALRLRAVSNSHHNWYLTYDGSTYVNVNNSLFYRSGGHCGRRFLSPLELSPTTTEAELIAALIKSNYERLDD